MTPIWRRADPPVALAAAAAAVAILLGAVATGPAYDYARAASVLARLNDPAASSGIAAVGRVAFRVEDDTVPAWALGLVPAEAAGGGGQGASHLPVRARLYLPASAHNGSETPALVLAHGVHRLGIDEPRLRRLAESLAGTGIAVLTPEIHSLMDYDVLPDGIDVIGHATTHLADRFGGSSGRVGLIGVSFGGGLAVVAAADPRYAPHIAFVATLGAPDDLGRVLRAFATNRITLPDGREVPFESHEYGPMIVVYDHIGEFFAPSDVAVAKESLRLWLWEDFEVAKKRAQDLSPAGSEQMQTLFGHHIERLAGKLATVVAADAALTAAVSPNSHLAQLTVPLFVLHGAGDTVIPPSEALFLARDAPKRVLQDVLVTAVISHAEVRGEPTWREKFRLMSFMVGLLKAARQAPVRP